MMDMEMEADGAEEVVGMVVGEEDMEGVAAGMEGDEAGVGGRVMTEMGYADTDRSVFNSSSHRSIPPFASVSATMPNMPPRPSSQETPPGSQTPHR